MEGPPCSLQIVAERRCAPATATRSVIRNGKLDYVAFEGLAATRAHCSHSPDDAHRHADLSTRPHRIARVDGEIHQHLLELDRVEQHGWRIVVKISLKADCRR